MKKLTVLLMVLGLALVAVPAIQAAEVPVASTDYIGFRDNSTTPPNNTLLTQGANFNYDTSNGFRIAWNIAQGTGTETGEWEYTYTISGAKTSATSGNFLPLTLAVKDFYLQVSDNFSIIPEVPAETTPPGSTIGSPIVPLVTGAPFHSLFWTAIDNTPGIDGTSFTIHFDSTSPPVWGSFYADALGVTANNGDFPRRDDTSFPNTTLDYIPTPNTVVPVPPTVLLLGSGLIGLAGLRLRRNRA